MFSFVWDSRLLAPWLTSPSRERLLELRCRDLERRVKELESMVLTECPNFVPSEWA